jgi:uncharacterized membrane protein
MAVSRAWIGGVVFIDTVVLAATFKWLDICSIGRAVRPALGRRCPPQAILLPVRFA